ncbi:glycosyltransferase [Roseovarius sp. TE539]|uniref:glycosyltransferase n=1 Tax=Roseovarius sp. TE539 TaxID=2249812 RepID=UPI000DE11686|nr:glycosyltransferase [Roseovarius sp. TE539]RBI70351.1 glycosyltransferase [Roseovarius sp. TE539]
MPDPISAIVPARDEAATIATVVAALRGNPAIGEVLVIDNASEDGTGALAAQAGARVITEVRPGMGHAVRTGLAAARYDWVVKVDADLDRFEGDLVARLLAARGADTGLVKGKWADPGDDMPMTRLLIRPALTHMWPGLAHLEAPNSGIYLIDRSCIAVEELRGDYAADLDAMIRVHCAGRGVAEADIGRIEHDRRDITHYNAMASVIMGFLLERHARDAGEALVVIAPGAPPVIAGCLGLLAARLRAGGRVVLCLEEAGGPGAAALHAALSRFPTALFRAPADAVAAVAGATACRVICPWPGAAGARRLAADLDARLLAMPVDGGGRVAPEFRAGLSLGSQAGADLAAAICRECGIDPVQPSECTLLAPLPPG